MTQLWFLPLAVLIGLAGTQTNLRALHTLKASRRERARWLLLALSWLPLACWFLSQFVAQDP